METPTHYNDISKELNQRYFLIIDEIIKIYPSYKANPNFTEYENNYKTNMDNLLNLQSEYFFLKNELNKDSELLQKEIKQIDETIYKLEQENKVLRKEFNGLGNTNNAAQGMLVDSTYLYNQQLTSNWLFLITMISLMYKYYR
jgi:hypothetical protein